MATGFQGFLQGFSTAGAEIIKEQDKQEQAAKLFMWEQDYQQKIKKDAETTQQQAIMENDKALLGQTVPNSPDTSGASSTIPATGSGVKPIDPSTGTVAPSAPVTTSPQAPAAPAADASSYGATPPTGPSANPTGVAAPGLPITPADSAPPRNGAAGNATITGLFNPNNDAPAGTPPLSSVNTPAAQQPATSTTPTGFTPITNLNQATTSEAATALGEFRAKNPGKFADANSVLAIINDSRKKDYKDNTELDIKTQEAADKHAESTRKRGEDAQGNPLTGPEVNKDLAVKLGVPAMGPEYSYESGGILPADASKLRAKNQLFLDKTSASSLEASHSLEQIATQYNKLADGSTTTGGLANAILPIRKNISEQIQEMNSLTKDEAVGNKTPGFPLRALGEVNLLLDAAQNTKLTPEAAKNIGNRIIAKQKEIQDFTKYQKNFFTVNHSLNGLEENWADYTANVPYLNSDGTPNLNRMSSADYFRSKSDGSAPTGTPTLVDAGIAAAKQVKASGLTQGQQNAADKFGF